MELTVLETKGLPDGSVLSVRSGPTRRQSPLPCVAPFKLPAGPWPLRVDVLAPLGRSAPTASLLAGAPAEESIVKVPLEARDGRTMSVTLQIFDGRPKNAADVKVAGRVGGDAPEQKKRGTEAEARAYLDRHRLHEFMHSLFEMLLRERPVDPYSFMAGHFQEAALLEPRDIPTGPVNDALVVAKATRSNISTAPTSTVTAAPQRKEPPIVSVPTQLPVAGVDSSTLVEITIQSMLGRSLARISVPPSERVDAIKARLESMIAVPVACQQLLWWAEVLPNDTTLEDHGITPGLAWIHLATPCFNGQTVRDPALQFALSGSSDGGLRMYNLADGEFVRDLGTGGPCSVLAVSVDPNSKFALTGSVDGNLRLWNLSDGACLRTIDAHTEDVSALQVDWASSRALSGSSDGTVKVWNIDSGELLATCQGGSTPRDISASWADNRACCGMDNGVVRMWDISTGAQLGDFSASRDAAEESGTSVSAFAIDCAGQRAVTGLKDGHLIYWHFGSSKGSAPAPSGEAPPEEAAKPPAPKMFLAHYIAIRAIKARWLPQGSKAFVGSDDGSLSLWRLDTQQCTARFARHVGFVWAIAVDWVKERALSGAFDGCTKLWNLRTGHCMRTMQAHCRPVQSIAAG